MSDPQDSTAAFGGRVGFRDGMLVIDLTDDSVIEALYRSRLADELGTLCGASEVLLKVRGQLRVRLHQHSQEQSG